MVRRLKILHQCKPLFIVGMPRSGTTLLEQVLASHSQIFGAGELGFFANIAEHLHEMYGLDVGYPDGLKELSEKQQQEIVDSYVALLALHGEGSMFVADKFPTNFFHIGMIAVLFPRSTIFHCEREPRDLALSNFFQNYSEGNFFSWSLEDIAHFYVQYERVMDHWGRIGVSNLVTISYQDMVTNFDSVCRTLIGRLQLDWEDACLTYFETDRDVRTASNWQVRQPIFKSSINRWRNYYPELTEKFVLELAAQRNRYNIRHEEN